MLEKKGLLRKQEGARDKVGYRCGLTQEPLSEQDVMLLCREHQYPARTGAK